MTALGGAGARAKSVLGIAAGMSPFLANQWERMVDDRRANNGITEDGNVIDNFGEYAGQLPGALTVALSERLGLRAVGAGGPIKAGVTELGTEVGSESWRTLALS